MLRQVLELVQAHGWFDMHGRHEMSVHLTQGVCAWLLLSRDGRLHTHVKFSEHVDLQAEAARCQAAAQNYPQLAPAFIGYASAPGVQALACQAVEFSNIDRHQLLHPRSGAALRAQLLAYFSAMRSARPARGAGGESNDHLLASLQRHPSSQELAAVTRRWCPPATADVVAAMRPLPQHGDLALNNMGSTSQGRLVIFDWEDFGLVNLPGLDLFTLELALTDGVPGLLAERARPAAAVGTLVAQACAQMGLPLADYHHLTMLYALVFRHLKRNYGPEVRERMGSVVQALDLAWASSKL